MKLKRIFKEGTEPPELDYISLGDTGTNPEQNFSVQLVTEMMGMGLMQIKKDKLTFHLHPESLVYTIKRVPGRYCCHCGEKLQDDTGGQLARLHIAQEHTGQESPDPNNPAGYESINYFECVLNPEQHEKYRVKEVARATIYPVKEG